jgi:hypothetical protein
VKPLPEPDKIPAICARRLAPNWAILAQITVCTIPPMALIAFSQLRAAGIYFFVLLLILLSYRLVRRDHKGMMSMIVGCMPVLMLLRNSLSYSSVELILGLGFVCWLVTDPIDVRRVFADRVVAYLSCFILLYWMVSFARTGDYSANLRSFELLLSALAIRLLGRYRSYLASAMIGLAVTTFAMGLAFARFGDRLGMAEIDGERIGNPISFGIPMALIFVLSLAENGRWLMLHEKPVLRIVTTVGAGILLLLSTSRGSWAVVVICLLVMIVGQKNRGTLIKYLAAGAIGISIWVYLADPAILDKYIYKTFQSSEYWSADNNARVAQWESFPRAFSDSPVWGFGPGSGKAVSLQYSGHKLIWHALYLHMAIECGLIGVFLLAAFLLTIIVRSIRYIKLTGEFAPLLGIISFIVVACTIPAIDGASGLFLGFGLLSFETSGLWIVRTRAAVSEAERVEVVHGVPVLDPVHSFGSSQAAL